MLFKPIMQTFIQSSKDLTFTPVAFKNESRDLLPSESFVTTSFLSGTTI